MKKSFFLMLFTILSICCTLNAQSPYQYNKGTWIILSDLNLTLGSDHKNTGILIETGTKLNSTADLGIIAGYNRNSTDSGNYEFVTAITTLGIRAGKLIKLSFGKLRSRVDFAAYASIFRPDNSVRFATNQITVGNNGYTFLNFKLKYFVFQPIKTGSRLKIFPGIGVETRYSSSSDKEVNNRKEFNMRLFMKVPFIFKLSRKLSVIAEPSFYTGNSVYLKTGISF